MNIFFMSFFNHLEMCYYRHVHAIGPSVYKDIQPDILKLPQKHSINAMAGRQNQISWYFQPNTVISILQRCFGNDCWYFHETLTERDFWSIIITHVDIMTKWVKTSSRTSRTVWAIVNLLLQLGPGCLVYSETRQSDSGRWAHHSSVISIH